MYPPDKLVEVAILSPEVNAQPSEPLPPAPVFDPGTPEPPYVVSARTQPFNPEA